VDRRHLFTGLIAAGVAAAAAGWWLYTHTGFQPSFASEVIIAGEVYETSRWIGVIAPRAPEKARACFRVDRPVEAPPELEPRPTPGPDWLRCFSVDFIREALARGDAKAYVAQRDDPPGWNRVIVVLPGNRVFMWHQPVGEE
jgi:hypothetical protein